jgi:hypothetical protein
MSVAEADSLHRELAATKEHASGLSGQVENFKKELGVARKEAARAKDLEAELAAAKEAAAASASQVKALEAALASASAKADAGEKAIALAKQATGALSDLAAL